MTIPANVCVPTDGGAVKVPERAQCDDGVGDCPHRRKDGWWNISSQRTAMGMSVHQTSYDMLRESLRDGLVTAVEPRNANVGCESVHYRATAALYALLGGHPIDRRGRCRCCHGPRALLARRRRICHVYVAVRYYLHQPDQVLLHHLASELEQSSFPAGGRSAPSRPCAAAAGSSDADATEVLRTDVGGAGRLARPAHRHPVRSVFTFRRWRRLDGIDETSAQSPQSPDVALPLPPAASPSRGGRARAMAGSGSDAPDARSCRGAPQSGEEPLACHRRQPPDRRGAGGPVAGGMRRDSRPGAFPPPTDLAQPVSERGS